MRKKNAFDQEAIQSLVNLGYRVYTEKDMVGSKSRPDLLAIKNGEVLIIETKSEEEAGSDNCLYTYDSDNIGDWRKYCKEKYPRDIAVWMVHIGGQIKSQIKRFGNKKGYWRIKEFEIQDHQTIPCLVCPTLYQEQVKESLHRLHITDFQLLELSTTQLLVKLDKKQLLDVVQH